MVSIFLSSVTLSFKLSRQRVAHRRRLAAACVGWASGETRRQVTYEDIALRMRQTSQQQTLQPHIIATKNINDIIGECIVSFVRGAGTNACPHATPTASTPQPPSKISSAERMCGRFPRLARRTWGIFSTSCFRTMDSRAWTSSCRATPLLRTLA